MMCVLLDAGHGGKDTGAQGHGVLEKDVALRVVYMAGEYLNHLMPHLDIKYTRSKDDALKLSERYKKINELLPDAFVSVHCNSIEDNPKTSIDEREIVDGYEIFYRDAEDFKLAEEIGRLFSRSEIWRNNRGIKQDVKWLNKHLAVLNSLPIPSVLVEIGFLSNAEECARIQNNLAGISELLAHGIYEYLGGGNGNG